MLHLLHYLRHACYNPPNLKLFIGVPSLAIDNPNTKTKGAIAEKGFNVDNTPMHCMIAMHKK